MKNDRTTEQFRIIPENERDIRIGSLCASSSDPGEPSNGAVLKIGEPMSGELSLHVVIGLSKLSLLHAIDSGREIDFPLTPLDISDRQLDQLVDGADRYVASFVGMPD